MANNIKFCERLFGKLKQSGDKTDDFVILDYFSMKTIQLLEDYDISIAERYSIMFRQFEEECEKSKKLKEYAVFFFALINLLECKHFYFVNNDKKELRENVENYINHLKSIIEEYERKEVDVDSHKPV